METRTVQLLRAKEQEDKCLQEFYLSQLRFANKQLQRGTSFTRKSTKDVQYRPKKKHLRRIGMANTQFLQEEENQCHEQQLQKTLKYYSFNEISTTNRRPRTWHN